MPSIKLRKRKPKTSNMASAVSVVEYVKDLRDRLRYAQIPLSCFEDGQWLSHYLVPSSRVTVALETRTPPHTVKEILEDAGLDASFLRWDCSGLFYVYY